MNTYKTKQLVEELNVVPLKADKTGKSPEVDQFLVELGNQSKGIPYYAIFPGDGGDPITFGGIISQQKVLESLQQAAASSSTDGLHAQSVQLDWQPYSRVTLEENLSEGRTVLVDFTADWSATCKTNEAVALNTYKTKQLVEELNVVPLKADKTGQAPEVDQFLVELGNHSKGIPYYAIFPGDGGDPITFGGIISQQKVLESLQQAAASSSANARRTAMN